jgi:F0F1-type ATP synthase membrane subunit b/b'
LQRVEESLTRYERTLREARAESYRLLERQQAEATGERQQKVGLVKKEVGDLIEGQKREIQAQADEARASLEGEARRVAATVSAQILGRSV